MANVARIIPKINPFSAVSLVNVANIPHAKQRPRKISDTQTNKIQFTIKRNVTRLPATKTITKYTVAACLSGLNVATSKAIIAEQYPRVHPLHSSNFPMRIVLPENDGHLGW